jgi:hypothetical protein
MLEGLAATEKLTVPLPAPLAPDVMVTNAALLTAVHGQPVVVVTATLPVPPVDVNVWFGGAMAKTHPAWLIVKTWSTTVIVALRGVSEVLAATVKLTVPLPVPLDPEVMVTNAALGTAVQAQPVVTSKLPIPPPAVND